jgi:hypothetical protein
MRLAATQGAQALTRARLGPRVHGLMNMLATTAFPLIFGNRIRRKRLASLYHLTLPS